MNHHDHHQKWIFELKNINIIHRCHWKPFTWSLWHRVQLWSQLVLKKDLRLYHKHTSQHSFSSEGQQWCREPFGHQRSWSDLRGHMVMVLFLLAGQSHVRPSPWGRWPEGSSTRVSQSLCFSTPKNILQLLIIPRWYGLRNTLPLSRRRLVSLWLVCLSTLVCPLVISAACHRVSAPNATDTELVSTHR